MIIRARYPKPKDVMLINDTPFKVEVAAEEKFSSIANMNLLTSLRTGRVSSYGKLKPDPDYKGINSINIFTTYLDYNYFAEGNYDFRNDFKKRKDLIVTKGIDSETYTDKLYETDEYFKLSNQKDVYVSARLWEEFQQLLVEITEVKPKLIILTGKWSLFFLTGCSTLITNMGNAKDRKPLGALNKFRSSIMAPSEEWNLKYLIEADELFSPIVIPIFHTLTAMSMPDKLSTIALDIEKLGWVYHQIINKGLKYYKIPDKEYLLGIEKNTIITYLDGLLERITIKPSLVSIDIETFYYSLIDCIGITDSVDSGLCIPFAHKGNANYWSLEDEIDILCKLREVMLHPGCLHVGQNYSFDCQYFHKLWHIDVTATYDSMILHHVLYNYLPKNLGFLASLYSEHYSYWKEDITATEDDPSTRWIYNIKDIQHTLEVTEVLLEILDKQPIKMKEFYRFQQNEIAPALVDMMNTGLKVDLEKKQKLYIELNNLLTHIEATINNLFNIEINLKSPNQIKALFKDFLKVVPIVNKKTKAESFGSDSMLVYLEEYPLYRPLITLILEYRSIGVFVRTFLAAKVDSDNRMRCSYNVAGTKSYRLSSRKNAFGNGCVPVNKAQVLTPTGWVTLAEQPAEIMQYSESGVLEFVNADYFTTDWDGELLSYSGRNFKGAFTPEHRVPNQHHRVVARRGREVKIECARKVASKRFSSILVSGLYQPKTELQNISDIWLQKLVMLSADGWRESKLTWRLEVKKERKKCRVKALFTDFTEHKANAGYARFKFADEGFTKELPVLLLELPLRQRQLVIEELSYWDSHRDTSKGKIGSFTYYTTIPSNATLVQTLCHLSDYSASMTIDLTNSNEYGNTATKPLYNVCISMKITNKCEDFRWFKTNYVGEVGCPIVESGLWLIKYDNEIHITGNCNLANVPSKGKIDLKYALMGYEDDSLDMDGIDLEGESVNEGITKLPNIKSLFLPDQGYTFFNIDYSGADAMVVAADSDCEYLLNFFNTSKDKLYIHLAREYLQKEVTTSDPFYKKIKQFVHLTNYGGMEAKAAASSGLSINVAKGLREWYFGLCPEIPEWHKRIASEVANRGYIENIFGARFWLLDKNCPTILNQAYALIPQSTIGILVNKGIVNIEKASNGRDIQTLLQVHDAAAGQFLTSATYAPQLIKDAMRIVIPYKKPLIIPADLEVSTISYGDVK